MNTQPLLFSEPAIAETGVWCMLTDGIDPAKWAAICRQIGQLTPDRFTEVQDLLAVHPKSSIERNPDSLISRLKRVFSFNQAEVAHLPLVCFGPEGLG